VEKTPTGFKVMRLPRKKRTTRSALWEIYDFEQSDEIANHQLNAPPCGGTAILATKLRS